MNTITFGTGWDVDDRIVFVRDAGIAGKAAIANAINRLHRMSIIMLIMKRYRRYIHCSSLVRGHL
jgi:hypothetical protein